MIRSEIKEIGEMAYFEDEPVLILFNTTAPEGLQEVCIIHDFLDEPNEAILTLGGKIAFGKNEYEITQLGNIANETLYDLGHVSLYFDWDEKEEILPGSVALKPNVVPQLKVGDGITFL